MRFLKNINDAALMGFVELQTSTVARAEAMVDNGRVTRNAIIAGLFGGFITSSTVAYAAGGGCSSGAAKKLQSFIESAANFAIGIGAGGAMLMLAIGALLVIMGGTPDRVSQGMKIIKNSVIGLGLLAAGLFIKYIVVNFVLGATGGSSSKCLNTGGGVNSLR